jgi:hypothetical protein
VVHIPKVGKGQPNGDPILVPSIGGTYRVVAAPAMSWRRLGRAGVGMAESFSEAIMPEICRNA